MRFHLSLRWLITLTHGSVFLITALLVGFVTFTLTKDYSERQRTIGEEAVRQEAEYIVFEKRQILAKRPNNLNRTQVTGYTMNLQGEQQIVYSFIDDPLDPRFRKTVPTAILLSNGTVFINGVSNSGFALLDLSGNNITAEYPLLKGRDFPVSQTLFGQGRDLFYTYAGPNSREKDGRHMIYWKTADGKVTALDSSSLPSGTFWITPLGFSASGESFYVARASTVRTFGALWRVTPSEKKIVPLQSIKGALTESVAACPRQEYALYIAAPLDPSTGEYGDQFGPSRLVMSNLKTDTAEVLAATPNLISTKPLVSCQGRKAIIKEQNDYLIIDLADKKKSRVIAISGTPLFFADDGESLIVKEDNAFALVNLATRKRIEIGGGVGYTVLGLSRQ